MVIEVVDNDPKYYEFIRLLRNDQRVQDGFIETKPISEEQQLLYMSKYRENYILALVDGKPAGYAGSIDRDIRVCVHPDFQNMGIGAIMIGRLMNKFPNSYAKIKVENEASKKLFAKCGFKPKYLIMEKDNETQSI